MIWSEFGYSIGPAIAFSYVPVEYAEPGTSVDVEDGDDRYAATVGRGRCSTQRTNACGAEGATMADRTVEEFVADVARPQPTPGGGSVAAVAGAMAAALSELVCAITVDKAAYADVAADLRDVRAALTDERDELLELADADAEAVEALMAAARDGDGSDREAATREATTVPLEIARRCGAVVDHAAVAAAKGNETAVSDATASAELANAALRAALDTVAVNVDAVGDEAFAAAVEDEAGALRAAGDRAVARARSALRDRT